MEDHRALADDFDTPPPRAIRSRGTLRSRTVSACYDGGSDPNCPATDRRGFPRPLGAHCDIGAVEGDGIFISEFE